MIQEFADWLVYGLFGLSADTPIGVAVNFFFYDTIKILILLFFISVLMGIINAYFPIASEKLSGYTQDVRLAVLIGITFRSYHSVLLMFIHTFVHRICQRRHSFGCHLRFPYYIAFGE